MECTSLRISVGQGYDVKIGPGLLDECGPLALKALGKRRAAIISDSSVAELYLARAAASLEKAGFDPCSFVFPAGESSKNMATLASALEFMARNCIGRGDCVIALGGGVTGDLAGFAAGCYMRGIPFVQMPTTLLAAVDSSVGGKTAVDLPSGKNLAGLFHQPSLVICDTDCLKTLPEHERLSGLAEAVKTAVLSGDIPQFLEPDGDIDMAEVIAGCVAYKGGVVERDEKEQGERKLLNLGHTVGHGVELLSGYAISHGFAVAAGTAIIARASARMGWCSVDTARRIVAALSRCGLPTGTEYGPAELAHAALSDKKRAGDSITLVIPSEIGACTLKSVPVRQLEEIIAAGMEEL